MNESTSKTVRQVIIAFIIVLGVTLNTLLLKGAGGSRDTTYIQDRIDLHEKQVKKIIQNNLEYLEERISKSELRQDTYYNSLNRRLDIVENKYDRALNNPVAVRSEVNVANTFSPMIKIEK